MITIVPLIIINVSPFFLGGWTAIQMISFSESELRFQNKGYKSFKTFKDLSYYSDHRQKVTSTALQQLQTEMGFKQLRFYCHKKKVGTVFHIMTNINPLGEAVVKYYTDNNMALIRPQTCGSYTVLPDDNSTLSKDCSKLGSNGTHADGKWSNFKITGKNRILQAIVRAGDDRRFCSLPSQRDCDDRNGDEASLSPGDTWAIFVR